MPPSNSDIAAAADRIIRLHGDHARQKIVDEIVQAIRAHDIVAAKRWDQLGQAVDQRLLPQHSDAGLMTLSKAQM